MYFFFKLLFCGSAGTSALNLVNFLVPWDPFSAVSALYCVNFFWVQVELGEQPVDQVPQSSPPSFIPHSAFL